MNLVIQPVATFQGQLRAPSDKSLTHRAYMFGAIASGESLIRMPLRGEDCESTRNCLAKMGLKYEWLGNQEIRLHPSQEWVEPDAHLDCGNSGTTMRLLSGLIASRPLQATLVGDSSLSKRPMRRIADPLRLMGAKVEGDTPPLHIEGGMLQGINYRSPVASAQVKSCILLATLNSLGASTVHEPSLSRDHTERMLRACGVTLQTEELSDGVIHRLVGGQQPSSFEMTVPADISSAAFAMVAAVILPQGRLSLKDLSVNPSRTGILDVFQQCGVTVEILDEHSELGEPVADLEVGAVRDLKSFTIEGNLVPRLIDEIPVLALLATQCQGTTVIKDARELRVKETDRIALVSEALNRMGANVEAMDDGMIIHGPTPLTGIKVDAQHDHRIAMTFAIAGLIAEGETVISGADSIATSYPDFERDLQSLIIV